MYRAVESRVGPPFREGRRFGGLSTRSLPLQLTRVECPDLLNADFSERGISRRGGFTRVSTSPLRDASLRLDGINDYGRIAHESIQVPGASDGLYVGIGVVLRQIPTAEVTIVNKGFGAGADRFFRLVFDPTGTGTWTATVYDTVAAALRTYSIADGDGFQLPVGRYRFLEWFQNDGGGAVTFRFYDDTGVPTTSATTTAISLGGYVASTQDITLGIPMSAAGTISAVDPYANVTLAELRWTTAINGSLRGIYNRELTPTETAICNSGGYWKLNDARADNYLNDSSATPNNGYIPNNAAEWVTTQTQVLGQSGLRFIGTNSWIRIQNTSTEFTGTFIASAPNISRWTMRGTFFPQAAPGSASIPDQTIFWMGTDPALPAPIGLKIVSNEFVAYYNDNGTNRPLPITSPTVSSIFGNRVRWAMYRHGTGNGIFVFTIAVPAGVNGFNVYGNSVALTGANPTTNSSFMAIGRMCSNFSFPYTFSTLNNHGPATGVIDDLQLIQTNLAAVGAFIGIGIGTQATGSYGPFTEVENWNASGQVHITRFYLKLNEGSGNILVANPSIISQRFICRLLPEESDGARWDVGLVDPYTPPETAWLGAYDRFLSDGSRARSLYAISGSTLYNVDVSAGTYTPIAAGLLKGPTGYRFTTARYGSKLILAGPVAHRPWVWNGEYLNNLGIQAPLSAPVVTMGGAASGSIPAGTYYLYVTFRNSTSGAESNPSPGVSFTAAANDKVDAIQLPISADPQVDQRRVWMTLISGTDGSTAYLSTTIEDNLTTNWTTDITTVPTTGTSLEYFSNQEAPQCSVVAAFKDYIFLGGNQLYPTRVYRNTAAGAVDGWDHDIYFVDLDLDTGDPVVALVPMSDRLAVEFDDGRGFIYLTGSTTEPFRGEILQREHGAVGPQSTATVMASFFYMAEDDVYVTDGYRDLNLSSPEDQSSPSIRYTIRNGLEPTRRRAIYASNYSYRNQVWFACTQTSNTRNNQVLVFDRDLALWSRYDLPLDCIAEYENASDVPSLYGAVFGRIVRLDDGTVDGLSSAVGGTVSSVDTGAKTITFTGTPFTGLTLNGLRVWLYKYATNAMVPFTIYSNTSSVLTLYDTPTDVAALDVGAVGAIPFYVEFLWDFGDPLAVKRLLWLKLSGISSNSSNYLRVSYKADENQRAWTYSGTTEVFSNWLSTETFKKVRLGGLGKSFRIRIAESGLATGSSSDPIPMTSGSLTFLEVAAEAEHILLEGRT